MLDYPVPAEEGGSPFAFRHWMKLGCLRIEEQSEWAVGHREIRKSSTCCSL